MFVIKNVQLTREYLGNGRCLSSGPRSDVRSHGFCQSLSFPLAVATTLFLSHHWFSTFSVEPTFESHNISDHVT